MSIVPDPLAGLPPDLTSGYRALADEERRFAAHAAGEHPDQVAAWHRLLTLLARAVAGGGLRLGREDPHGAEALRFRLLAGIGAGSAKLSLDAALAGYYGQSFVLTRHLLESWAHAVYVRARPEEAFRWYDQPGDPKHWVRPPGFQAVRRAIKPHIEPQEIVDRVDGILKLLDKGAHPSPELLAQTDGARPGQIVVGANYDRDLAAGALYYGVYATVLALSELTGNAGDPEGWAAELGGTSRQLRSWLEAWLGDE